MPVELTAEVAMAFLLDEPIAQADRERLMRRVERGGQDGVGQMREASQGGFRAVIA